MLAPGHSPLPSSTTMPLSLQQLGSAASSTDSLNGPVSAHSRDTVSRAPVLRHQHSSSYFPARADLHTPHVTVNSGQGNRVVDAAAGGTKQPARDYSKPASSPNGSTYGFKRSEPSPSIYSASSARSTSSVNSLPPASESNLSASTMVYAHSDAKVKGRGLNTPSHVAVTSRKRVPNEIEEAVRNLGLAPPTSSVKLDSKVTPSHLTVPAARPSAGSPHHHQLSRTASANTSAASASDAASLSGTIASSIASTSQDSQSISSRKSTTSKTKKKKASRSTPSQASTTTTTVIKASSSTGSARNPAASSSMTPDAKVKKKKKKKLPLPTSSGKPPGSVTTSNATVPSTPPPLNTRSTQAKSPRIQDASSTAPASNNASTQHHSSVSHAAGPSTSAVPLHRPVAQSVPSRNRHLDESALLRRFPATSNSSTNSPVHLTQATSRAAITRSQPLAEPAANVQAINETSRTTTMTGSATGEDVTQPAPPAWSPPLQTITLAFTPMHAYLSAYHDPADQASTGISQPTSRAAIPDSPPPVFRSRSPSPEAGPSNLGRIRQQSIGSRSDAMSLPDVDLDALEERSRGYASSENEVDLLNSQGRHSGTSTPPLDSAHGDSRQGLRWQVRHWEAWRREGISLEERLQRLQEWKKNSIQQVDTGIAVPSFAQETNSRNTPEESSHSTLEESGTSPSDPAVHRDTANEHGQGSPTRIDLSQAAVSGGSQPRFPSVGTVRRARLQRFEAERQHSKSMSAVVQSSPASSSVSLPRGRMIQQLSTDASTPPSKTNAEHSRPSEEVRLATLQAALGRHPIHEVSTTGVTLDTSSEQATRRPADASGLPASEPSMHVVPEAETSASGQALPSAGPAHQLARQLAAEIEGKRTSTSSSQISNAVPSTSLTESSQAEFAVSADTNATSESPDTSTARSNSPTKAATEAVSSAKHLQKAASRISRLFRPNMGPRPQPPRSDVNKQELPKNSGQITRTDSPAVVASTSMPIMTLPKAPPRLTTDPLSTDNLRKLSKHQLRSPSMHGAASPSSSSSEDETDSDSSSAENRSDSGSDSADDESTKKPPSTVTHLGARAPSSLVSSFANTNEVDREAAAASWRRTEDGRRHSALLSRPLSIKRKPPPVPPKRWGGVWDRDVIQERLKRSFNLLDIAEQADSDEMATPHQSGRSTDTANHPVMPGTLPSGVENDNWEVVGQDLSPAPSTPPAHWEVFGQPVDAHYTNDGTEANLARRTESTLLSNHIYSEADFSTMRRQFPPIRAADRLLATADIPQRNVPVRFVPSETPLGDFVTTGKSLQRSSAVRRPQSMLGMSQRVPPVTDSIGGKAESARLSPPSPEIRSRLSSRPRHVYSASVPSVSIAQNTQQPSVTTRRPLPPLPTGSGVGSAPYTPRRSERSTVLAPSASERSAAAVEARPTLTPNSDIVSPSARVHAPSPGSRIQEYTDLEVMLSSMDEGGIGNVCYHLSLN